MTRDLEGKISEDHGYCLWAGQQGEDFLTDGLIDDEGNAIFNIRYSALYFNLFVNEVLDGIVTEILPEVIILNLFISKS